MHFQTSLNKMIVQSGMTFNPSIDCRKDLVNFYGYTHEQVNAMSDDELFSIMDKIEDAEKGYIERDDVLPVHLQDEKCSCGGDLKVLYIDCETRGDCEIYNCECSVCSKEKTFNYAEEWYVYDEDDAFGDILMSIDNACYNCKDGKFNKAKEVITEAKNFIEKSNQKDKFTEWLNQRISNLSKRYEGLLKGV